MIRLGDLIWTKNKKLLTHVFFVSSYQFLEDAYRNHKQYLENMTQQLQEKRKAIEDVSSCISTGYSWNLNTVSGFSDIHIFMCNIILTDLFP